MLLRFEKGPHSPVIKRRGTDCSSRVAEVCMDDLRSRSPFSLVPFLVPFAQRCALAGPSHLPPDGVRLLAYHPALFCSSSPFPPPLQQPPALSAAVLAACRSTMRAGLSGVCSPLHQVHLSIHQRVRCLAQGVCGGGGNTDREECEENRVGERDTKENEKRQTSAPAVS